MGDSLTFATYKKQPDGQELLVEDNLSVAQIGNIAGHTEAFLAKRVLSFEAHGLMSNYFA